MSNLELCFMPATEMAAAIASGRVSAREVMSAVIERAQALDPKLNAFCVLLPDEAMAEAAAADDAQARGQPLGPLHGVPVTIKDMVFTRGIRTMQGSRIYAERVPDADAPMVERLKAAGAIVFGKTTTPEFGWKAVTDSPVSGITRNPWDIRMTPGGSSGGAAAQIAAGIGPLASGGDGAGSIRIPASFSGVFGIKPQFGRIPTWPQGVGQLAHLGPLTRTVADAALYLEVTAGPNDRDRLSLEKPPPAYRSGLDAGIKGLRVAWSPDLGYVDNLDPQVATITAQAAAVFESLGAEVEELSDPGLGDPKPIIDVFWRAHMATLLEPYLPDWQDDIDPGLLACAQDGLNLGPLDYSRAHAGREAYWLRAQALFERFDLLLTPTVAVLPFEAGELFPGGANEHPWDWIRWAPYSFPFNLTNQPAASVPAGFSAEGLPVGLQIVGRRFAEDTVLKAAAAFEAARPWRGHRPTI